MTTVTFSFLRLESTYLRAGSAVLHPDNRAGEVPLLWACADIENVIPKLLALLFIPRVGTLVHRYDEAQVCACDESYQ